MGISLIEKREIEALIAVALIKGYAEVIGLEKSLEIAAGVIRGLARDAGRQTAAERDSNSLRDLGDVVKTLWSHSGEALEVEFIKLSETVLEFRVTRCRYAEQYENLGLRKFGYTLSCSRDVDFAQGFNPRIKMSRTQTIMEGASCCDFKFTLNGILS
jgi:fumarate reductase iron-sulfur subunit